MPAIETFNVSENMELQTDALNIVQVLQENQIPLDTPLTIVVPDPQPEAQPTEEPKESRWSKIARETPSYTGIGKYLREAREDMRTNDWFPVDFKDEQN